MDQAEQKEKFKKRIINYLQDKWDVVFILALVLGISLRLQYLTINQAVWWDEAEYLSTALHWAFHIPYEVNYHRGILFPFLSAMFLKIGLKEMAIRFFLVFIPSIGVIVLTYLLGKRMYNKAVGSIAAFITSTFWVSLFWGARVSTDFLGLFFALLAFYCFWVGFVEQKNTRYLILAGAAGALGFLTRPSNLLIGVILAVFLLITERVGFLKEKKLWFAVLAAIVVSLPYFIWNIVQFGSPLAFTQGYDAGIQANASFAWNNLTWVYSYLNPIFFIMFVVGAVSVGSVIVGLDLLWKKQETKLKPDLLSILTILIVLAFFIFYIRSTEDRWLLPMSPFLFLFAGKGIVFVMQQAEKIQWKQKINAGMVVLIAVLVIGSYMNYNQADQTIQAKKDSYVQVRSGAEWMKANSGPNDIILSISRPQTMYYSQRNTLSYSEVKNEQEFANFIKDVKPKYFTISVFEPHPGWIYQFIQNNKEMAVPVQGYFFDAQQTKPALIIYQVKQ
ncbi:glycosyltransferase family 39 protein [Candidatus Woesearchaeota archaeon]|nr:glycosyltransferase family 39 protein [Candidatus Woesearchaeota archaeon]